MASCSRALRPVTRLETHLFPPRPPIIEASSSLVSTPSISVHLQLPDSWRQNVSIIFDTSMRPARVANAGRPRQERWRRRDTATTGRGVRLAWHGIRNPNGLCCILLSPSRYGGRPPSPRRLRWRAVVSARDGPWRLIAISSYPYVMFCACLAGGGLS